MRCYYHRDIEAIGICKSCNRGLCAECAAEVGDGLACTDRCEEMVAQLNSLLSKGSGSYQTARGVYLRSGMLYLLASAGFFGFGLFAMRSAAGPGLGYAVIAFGVFLLLFSLSCFRAAQRYGGTVK